MVRSNIFKKVLIVFLVALQFSGLLAMEDEVTIKVHVDPLDCKIVDYSKDRHKMLFGKDFPVVDRPRSCLYFHFFADQEEHKIKVVELEDSNALGFIQYYCEDLSSKNTRFSPSVYKKNYVAYGKREGMTGMLSNLFVLKECRSNGLGRKLLEFAVEDMFKNGASCIIAHIVDGFDLYRSVGFNITDPLDFFPSTLFEKAYQEYKKKPDVYKKASKNKINGDCREEV